MSIKPFLVLGALLVATGSNGAPEASDQPARETNEALASTGPQTIHAVDLRQSAGSIYASLPLSALSRVGGFADLGSTRGSCR
jgi:hypothetical protein